ncbi:hypothetical protein CRG98_048704, partial [Punica granatum]
MEGGDTIAGKRRRRGQEAATGGEKEVRT